jgi:predicted amidophosphoribosyltransferase
MPLVICPDCGARISDMALLCPRCGRPCVKKPKADEDAHVLIVSVVAVAVIIFACVCYFIYKNHN